MIVGPRVKEALRAKLEDADTEFVHVDDDTEWAPKLWLFLDSSLIESSTEFELGDPCGNVLRDMTERSRFYLYVVAIADDDRPSSYDIELEVAEFVALVAQTIAADTTLGVSMAGVDWLSSSLVSNETSTRKLEAGAGGQWFNACRAFLEVEVNAHIRIAELATS